MTRDYEALVIFKTGGTEQEIARLGTQLDEQIKQLGGRIDHSQQMGRRKLAFRILKQVEGYYYLVRFHAPTERVTELDRLLRLHEAVVRFIILTEEELSPLQPTTAAPVAART